MLIVPLVFPPNDTLIVLSALRLEVSVTLTPVTSSALTVNGLFGKPRQPQLMPKEFQNSLVMLPLSLVSKKFVSPVVSTWK